MPKKMRKTRQYDRPTIPEFFEGKSVFITGATGFMGKVLVEKLLRSCPDINKIYILMRPKNGKDINERMNILTSLPLFVKVKRENLNFADKIVALKGDVSELRLGLSDEDLQTLKKEVSIVFHAAASVRFDDPLKKATLMNTRGTLELIKLAKEMTKLESFLHVSTTYCNTHKEVIDERVYPAPADWRSIIKIAERTDPGDLEVFTPKILGPYPNTYTFTKGLAEHIIYDHKDEIPSVIFRPSIVISSMTEPMPGWIDSFNGPVGLIVASGKGIVRSVYSDPCIRADYIPVDVAVKAMIVAAWDRGTNPEGFTDLPVYNCAANEVKRVTQSELVEIGKYVTAEVPLNDILWLPGGNVTKCKVYHYIKILFLQLIPALMVDTFLKLSNKKPMLLRIQRKIFLANQALEYFVTRQWSFINERTLKLDEKILEDDRPAFAYYTDDINVIEYFRNCTYGAREYLLKEDNTELPEAKKHYRRMFWIDRATKAIFLFLCAYLAIRLHFIQTVTSTLRGIYASAINELLL